MASKGSAFLADLERLRKTKFQNEEERIEARMAVAKLLVELETPWETVHRLGWIEPTLVSALKVLVDVDLFARWVRSGKNTQTVKELSSLCGMDEELLARLARHLAATGILKEAKEDTYTLASFSEALAQPGFSSSINFMLDSILPSYQHLPKFLAKQGYNNPTDTNKTNWNDYRGSNEGYVDFITSDARRTIDFQNVMIVYNDARGSWVELYPTQDLFTGLKSDRPVLVDVGGGKGRDIEKFRQKHPKLPAGALVIQELPGVVPNIQVHGSISVQAHNLFDEQQLKGARAYYTHIVLHAYSDTEALKILKRFAAAMEPGYSRLLLNEKVIPPENAPSHVTAEDITMMATTSSCERTTRNWESLLPKAGLKLRKIWSSPEHLEAIVEAEKA